jgi:CRISPR system Cascade subunit CasA
MNSAFSLLTEGWIPCVRTNGRSEMLGLRDVLVEAHTIREIYCRSPLTIAALHRLLLATTHRLFGPRDRNVWTALWIGGAGKWDSQKLDSYFDKWKPRFNLFDRDYPFYQRARFSTDKEPEPRPLSQLALELSSGNNMMLFDHHCDLVPESVMPSEAARRLVTTQSFTIGFGISHKLKRQTEHFRDGPCSRGALFLVQGDNLFQTLMLSMRCYPDPRSRLSDDPDRDRPVWEMDDPFEPKRNTPLGYLDYLTWQSLQIRLEQDDGGQVKAVYRIQGLGLDKDVVLDPLKSYRTDKKTGKPIVRGFDPERALWRDSVALLELTDTDGRATPENLRLLADLVRARTLNREQQFRYLAIGLATEEGQARNVLLWRLERMPLPLAYLHDPGIVEQLRDVLNLAEKANQQLEEARDWLVWLWLKPDKYERFDDWRKSNDYRKCKQDKGFVALQDRFPVSRRYWWRLELPFAEVMIRLAKSDSSATQALLDWRDTLEQTARHALNETTDGIESSARALRAVAKAEEQLERGLGIALKVDWGGAA